MISNQNDLTEALAPCPNCGAEWEEPDLGLGDDFEGEGGLTMQHKPGCTVAYGQAEAARTISEDVFK